MWVIQQFNKRSGRSTKSNKEKRKFLQWQQNVPRTPSLFPAPHLQSKYLANDDLLSFSVEADLFQAGFRRRSWEMWETRHEKWTGSLTSFGESNEPLIRRSDRTGCIKRWLEVEKGHDGPCAGWGKAGKPADREESEPLASVRQRWSQRPGREMSSGISQRSLLLFLDSFKISIVVTTVYIYISFLVTPLAFPWVCFEWDLLLAIRSTRHKTLCNNKNTLLPLKETINNILQHYYKVGLHLSQ